MATLKRQGDEVARYSVTSGDRQLMYSARSNGRILMKNRILGKWEGWRVHVTVDLTVMRADMNVILENYLQRTYGTHSTITRIS